MPKVTQPIEDGRTTTQNRPSDSCGYALQIAVTFNKRERGGVCVYLCECECGCRSGSDGVSGGKAFRDPAMTPDFLVLIEAAAWLSRSRYYHSPPLPHHWACGDVPFLPALGPVEVLDSVRLGKHRLTAATLSRHRGAAVTSTQLVPRLPLHRRSGHFRARHLLCLLTPVSWKSKCSCHHIPTVLPGRITSSYPLLHSFNS